MPSKITKRTIKQIGGKSKKNVKKIMLTKKRLFKKYIRGGTGVQKKISDVYNQNGKIYIYAGVPKVPNGKKSLFQNDLYKTGVKNTVVIGNILYEINEILPKQKDIVEEKFVTEYDDDDNNKKKYTIIEPSSEKEGEEKILTIFQDAMLKERLDSKTIKKVRKRLKKKLKKKEKQEKQEEKARIEKEKEKEKARIEKEEEKEKKLLKKIENTKNEKNLIKIYNNLTLLHDKDIKNIKKKYITKLVEKLIEIKSEKLIKLIMKEDKKSNSQILELFIELLNIENKLKKHQQKNISDERRKGKRKSKNRETQTNFKNQRYQKKIHITNYLKEYNGKKCNKVEYPFLPNQKSCSELMFNYLRTNVQLFDHIKEIQTESRKQK